MAANAGIPAKRKLAAILAMDAVGYSRLIARDEQGTLRLLETYGKAITDLAGDHGGRIFGRSGDGLVAEFPSAVEAVRCAVAIQRALHRRNADLPVERRLEFRTGVNVGDVVVQGDDLLGDGVNIAARMQETAPPRGICITRSVFEQVQGKVRFPIAVSGERQLKNIPQPVAVYSVDWTLDEPNAHAALGGGLALPDKPSIAVLPFANMSGDPEQEYFADGITEDLLTALSQYRWFFVVARNSTFVYKGRAVDVKQVAREQGVRYVLEGSVRRAGARVRITAQLIDAESGNHLWAEKYDRDLADVFAVQDEISQSVVGVIEPEMLLVESRRAARKAPGNLDAFDCYVRGMWHFYKTAADENREAIRWMQRAIELDPNFAQGHMGLARAVVNRIWYGWSLDVDTDVRLADAAAQRAVTLDERDPYTHYALCLTSILEKRHQQGLEEAQRSIDLTPNFALGYFALAAMRIFMGRFAESIDPLLRCIRLNPQYPQMFLFWRFLAVAHYHQRNYEEALRFAEAACSKRRLYVQLRTLLACLGQLGRLDQAKAVLAEIESLRTADADRLQERTTPYLDPAHKEHFLEGLRKGGMRI